MRRIVIVGCSGSGKSTLARALGARLGLPVIHLDALFWGPRWRPGVAEDFRAKVSEAVAGEDWICDGGFSSTYDLRLPRADRVIWLDRPRWLCLWRVLARWLTHIGRTRPDMAPDCPEKVDAEFVLYIWNWRRRNGPELQAALALFAPHVRLTVLRSDRESRAFLAELPRMAEDTRLRNLRDMAADKVREREAEEWADGLIGDSTHGAD